MTISVVEPRPCKTCSEPANYIGYGAGSTVFACPACRRLSSYYDDEEPDAGSLLREAVSLLDRPSPATVAMVDAVSVALAGHTAAALDKIVGTP